jgi:hypothetical protein
VRIKVTLLLHIHAIYLQSKNKSSCEDWKWQSNTFKSALDWIDLPQNG